METTVPTLSPNKKESKWIINLKKYLKINFSLKNNLWHLLWIAVGATIALIPSLTCNLMVRNGSWTGIVSRNPDIAFGIHITTAGIYTLQSIICIFIGVAIIFTHKWYYVILLSIAFLGGFFNLIDRATSVISLSPDGRPYVIDYLPTGGTVSNFPDVFILIGIIGFGVVYVIMNIVSIVKEKKAPKVEDPTIPPSPTIAQDSEIK